jgi:hypothetical protein
MLEPVNVRCDPLCSHFYVFRWHNPTRITSCYAHMYEAMNALFWLRSTPNHDYNPFLLNCHHTKMSFRARRTHNYPLDV